MEIHKPYCKTGSCYITSLTRLVCRLALLLLWFLLSFFSIFDMKSWKHYRLASNVNQITIQFKKMKKKKISRKIFSPDHPNFYSPPFSGRPWPINLASQLTEKFYVWIVLISCMGKRFVWNFFDPEKFPSLTHFDYDSFLKKKCTNSTLGRPVTNQSFICCRQPLLWFIWFDEMCHQLSHLSDNILLYDSSMTHFGKVRIFFFEKFQNFFFRHIYGGNCLFGVSIHVSEPLT